MVDNRIRFDTEKSFPLADKNYNYLKNIDTIQRVKHTNQYVKNGEGLAAKRKIFIESDFDVFEKSKVREFKQQVKHTCAINMESFTNEELLKILYAANFDFTIAKNVIFKFYDLYVSIRSF